jgi:hypothetical protein
MPLEVQSRSRRAAPRLLILGTRWGWKVNTTRRSLYTRGKAPIPREWETAWAPGPVRTLLEAIKFLTSIEVLTPDPPTPTESLYPLSYPGPGT